MLTLARSPKLEVFTVPDTLPLQTRLEIAVAMLPDDPIKIARLLRDLGIRGTRAASNCPLANYLKAALEVPSVGVYHSAMVHTAAYRFRAQTAYRDSAQTESTEAMVDFIEWFDTGFRQVRLRRALTLTS